MTLSSSNPAAASVPAQVMIPAGTLPDGSLPSGFFHLITQPVSQQTSASITATLSPSVTQSVTFTVTPFPLVKLILPPPPLVGGQSYGLSLQLAGPAPANTFVDLTSSNGAVASVAPFRVNIPVGATTVGFNLITQAVSQQTSLVLTARLGVTILGFGCPDLGHSDYPIAVQPSPGAR